MNLPASPPCKGRGAAENRAGRYEQWERAEVEDGWYRECAPASATQVSVDFAKSVISSNDSPDLPFDHSINMYRGCEHGCVYCYARPTHAYLGYSPGLDFETKLVMKPDCAELLKREFASRSYECRTIALGTNTDPYQPIERDRQLTRRLLEVFLEHRHPVSITTKSWMIVRDRDLLEELARRNLVRVQVSVTTLDAELSRWMEPRASAPHRRLEAIRRLSDAGVVVGALFAPVIPALNDHELESILRASKESGAAGANWIMLRLPLEVKDLFYDWLRRRYPLKYERVRSLVRQVRRGQDSDSRFHTRFRGQGALAQSIENRFRLAAKQLGLSQEIPPLDESQFRKNGAQASQTSLFE